MNEQKKSLSSLLPAALEDEMRKAGQPVFRAGQVFEWLHKKNAVAFDEMTNLPAALREQLEEQWVIDAPQVAQKQVAKDGTVKYLLRLADGNHIEAVLMHYHHGNTLCVSSQVGCRMGCRFCASTQGGLVRGLSAGEMACEVYAAQKDSGEKVSNIVLMGIGEPLDNFDSVMDFISIITHPKGQDVSNRNISLSTCGLVPGIEKLAERKLGLTLSVSLHAAEDETRSGMMPVNNAYPIGELMAACRAYQKRTGRRISYEYALVRGVNDSVEDAQKLAALLRGAGGHVNLIPVNPVDGSPYGPADKQNIDAFCQTLQKLGQNATVRRRLGADIDAACGQLRQKAGKDLDG